MRTIISYILIIIFVTQPFEVFAESYTNIINNKDNTPTMEEIDSQSLSIDEFDTLQDTESQDISQDTESQDILQDTESQNILQDTESQNILQDTESQNILQDTESQDILQDIESQNEGIGIKPISSLSEKFTSGSVPVQLTTDTPEFSAVLPTKLSGILDANNNIITSSEAKIINKSAGPIYVQSIEIETVNDWSLVDYKLDFSTFDEDDKKVGIHLNGDYLIQSSSDTVMDLTPNNWPRIGKDKEIPLSYSIKIPNRSNNLIDEEIINVTLIVDWYKMESHNTDPRPTVIIDTNGGFFETTPEFEPKNTFKTPTNPPSRPGYKFLGYYKDEEYTNPWTESDLIEEDSSIHLKWEYIDTENLITITFYDDDGTIVTTKEVPKGVPFQEPLIDIPIGKKLEGWYTNEDSSEPWDFERDVTSLSLELHARYSAVEYNVSFDTTGGSSIESIYVAFNTKIPKPEDPVLRNNKFDGWYKDSSLTQSWDFDIDVVTSPITLYAKWIDLEIVVSFILPDSSTLKSETILAGEKITVPEMEIPNGKEVLFLIESEGSRVEWDFDTEIKTHLNIFIEFISARHTVTFYSENSELDSLKVSHEDRVTKPEDPIRENLRFRGWYVDKEYKTPWNFDTDTVTSSLELYAKWVDWEVDIIYISPDGSVLKTETIPSGTTLTVPEIEVPVGKEAVLFLEVDGQKAEWDLNTEVETNLTLFIEIVTAKYTVEFITGNDVILADRKFEYLEKIDEPVVPNSNKLEIEGWYMDKYLTTEWNFNYGKVTGPLKLYAKWMPELEEGLYKVKFNLGRYNYAGHLSYVQGGDYLEPFEEFDSYGGSTLVGYYKDPEMTELFDFANTRITENKIVYTKWVFNPEDWYLTNYPSYVGISNYSGTSSNVIIASLEDKNIMLSSKSVSNKSQLFGNKESLIENVHILDNVSWSNNSSELAFYNCIKLKKVTGLENTKVENMYDTFRGCTSLIDAGYIPDSVTNLSRAFHECSSLLKVSNIPTSITKLDFTFYGCSSLVTTPKLPQGIISLHSTFANCTSLVEIPNIPNSVTNLEQTFSGCISLISVPNIPNSVVNMNSTFSSCTSLTEISNIPDSVTSAERLFENCKSLISIPRLPDSFEKIDRLFYGCESLVEIVNIPSSAKTMSYTFYNCKSLLEIPYIPDSVTDLSYAFYYCESLKEIPNIPASTTNMAYSFYRCLLIPSIPAMPDTVTNLKYAFYSCKNLSSITNISSSVLDMSWTFMSCDILERVPEIPPLVTNMERTFQSCTSLLEAPEIPPSVINMTYTFQGCTSLLEASKIPSSVTDMTSTFSSCTSLVKAPEIPPSVINMTYTFQGCTSLLEAPKIPSSVTDMTSTFSSCTSLLEAPEIPPSVITMESTFSNCTSLMKAHNIPYSVKSLVGVFKDCAKLEGEIVFEAILGFNTYLYAFENAGKNTTNGVVLNWKYPATENHVSTLVNTKKSGKVKKGICLD